jgi:hypothetical protein
LIDNNLDLTSVYLGILVTPFHHRSMNLNDKFPTQFTGFLAESGINYHVENQLDYSIAVAQVNKGHPTKIA